MSGKQTQIDQILLLSREMYRLGQEQNWDELVRVDSERAELVNGISTIEVDAEVDHRLVSEIRYLQDQIISLTMREKSRINQEYQQAKIKLDVSSHYLKTTG